MLNFLIHAPGIARQISSAGLEPEHNRQSSFATLEDTGVEDGDGALPCCGNRAGLSKILSFASRIILIIVGTVASGLLSWNVGLEWAGNAHATVSMDILCSWVDVSQQCTPPLRTQLSLPLRDLGKVGKCIISHNAIHSTSRDGKDVSVAVQTVVIHPGSDKRAKGGRGESSSLSCMQGSCCSPETYVTVGGYHDINLVLA